MNDEGGAVIPRDLPLVDGDVSRGIVIVSGNEFFEHRVVRHGRTLRGGRVIWI